MKSIGSELELELKALKSIVENQKRLANDMLFAFDENLYSTAYYQAQLKFIRGYELLVEAVQDKISINNNFNMQSEMAKIEPDLYG